MKVAAIILCALFAISNAAPSGPIPAAHGTTYGAWPAVVASHGTWPAAVSYGAWPSTGYYTATKSINVAVPQHISYASIPTFLAPAPAVVGSQYHAQDSLGQYTYGYTSSDGQAKVESKSLDGTISGRYSYTDPTGKLIETKYKADKEGFKVEGDHLPQAPEVPEVPEEVAEAYEKAKEDFEEAKNRNAPSPVQPLETVAITPIVYHAPVAVPLPSTYSKSAYAYVA